MAIDHPLFTYCVYMYFNVQYIHVQFKHSIIQLYMYMYSVHVSACKMYGTSVCTVYITVYMYMYCIGIYHSTH